MESIQAKIKELESSMTGSFYDDLYIEQQINYWKRQLAHYQRKLELDSKYF
jgi:hypothetical protein